MFYVVNFEIKNPEREATFLNHLETSFQDENRCMPNSFFIVSDLDKKALYNQLRKGLENEDLLLVAEVKLPSIMGWLPASSVDWLAKKY